MLLFNLTIDSILTSLIYLGVAFVLFFAGKIAYRIGHRGIDPDHELVEKDNLAYALSKAGYFIGLLLVIGSALAGEAQGHILDNLIDIVIYAGLGIVLLNLSLLINDKLVLRKFSVIKEIITDQNAGTGIVQAAASISTGLIIYGVLAENEDAFYEVLLLWVLAQVAMVLASWVYNLITPYDIHDHIEKDNVAVGVGFAGALIAIANLIRFGVSLEADTWIETIENIGLETGTGLLLLPIARFLTDKILLPKRRLTDEIVHQEKPNIGAAVIEAFAYVGGSVLICWSFA